MVTEVGVVTTTSSLGASLRLGVRDALSRAATLMLPHEAHAATMSEDPCEEQRWDLYEATANMAWKEAQYLDTVLECEAVPRPSCIQDIADAAHEFDEAIDAAIAANQALFQCLNRMTNSYAGGYFNDHDQWCELWFIWVSEDGGLTWWPGGSFEVCFGGGDET